MATILAKTVHGCRRAGLIGIALLALGSASPAQSADTMMITAGGPIPTLPIAACMAAGVPIVAVVSPTVAELLEDNHNCLMLKEARSRLLARRVRLEDDVEARDVYDRRLAYVYLDGERFEDELLRRGYARLLVIEPNHAHARTMLEEEFAAKRRDVGLWGAC